MRDEAANYRQPWMSDDQWSCSKMLADVFRGWHHLPGTILEYGQGIRISARASWLATFDYDQLTVLVVLAHDRMIRVEIEGSSPGRVGIVLHQRHMREGDFYLKHPTIEVATADIRSRYPKRSEVTP